MILSKEQITLLTRYRYYYDWKASGNIFVGKSILNGISWKIQGKEDDLFDVYVWQSGTWKFLRTVREVTSTYAVVNDWEDGWCKRHPERKKKR